MCIAFFLSTAVALGANTMPFALDPVGDGVLAGGGLAIYGGSLALQTLKPAPDALAVDPAGIPLFDRAYPSAPSATLTNVGDYTSIAMAVLPLLLLPGRSGSDILTLGIMYAETLEIAYSVDSLLKSTVVRYRPYAYSTSTPADFSNPAIAESFPSANSTLAFAAASFAGYAFGELYPDSRLRPWIWASGLALSAAVSTFLVAGGDHFVSDAVTGAAIGAASGILVPLLHERFASAKVGSRGAAGSLSIAPGPGSLLLRVALLP